MNLNERSMDSVCSALCYAMGIEPPEHAASPSKELADYVDSALEGKKADRIFMYNPDAIAEWIADKYPQLMKEADTLTELKLPLCTVMPSVTPVCFATMYTGAQPEVHGIRKYEKPVLKIDTIFDALLRAAKKPVIVAVEKCSIANIFLERDMDYFIYPTYEEANAKAAEIILEDKYDFVVVYNGNYDSAMHKHAPESIEALSELRANSKTFGIFYRLIEKHWRSHNTLIGFAMDHGCHEIDEGSGSHGLDMPEDLNIRHLYRIYPAKKANN
ncbi:MAG: hypothetical protein E7641_08405 [Ruminococcaceae bacterium]|nr:hypothetical protein [Oscillospiraceae bacterium]